MGCMVFHLLSLSAKSLSTLGKIFKIFLILMEGVFPGAKLDEEFLSNRIK